MFPEVPGNVRGRFVLGSNGAYALVIDHEILVPLGSGFVRNAQDVVLAVCGRRSLKVGRLGGQHLAVWCKPAERPQLAVPF